MYYHLTTIRKILFDTILFRIFVIMLVRLVYVTIPLGFDTRIAVYFQYKLGSFSNLPMPQTNKCNIGIHLQTDLVECL